MVCSNVSIHNRWFTNQTFVHDIGLQNQNSWHVLVPQFSSSVVQTVSFFMVVCLPKGREKSKVPIDIPLKYVVYHGWKAVYKYGWWPSYMCVLTHKN